MRQNKDVFHIFHTVTKNPKNSDFPLYFKCFLDFCEKLKNVKHFFILSQSKSEISVRVF